MSLCLKVITWNIQRKIWAAYSTICKVPHTAKKVKTKVIFYFLVCTRLRHRTAYLQQFWPGFRECLLFFLNRLSSTLFGIESLVYQGLCNFTNKDRIFHEYFRKELRWKNNIEVLDINFECLLTIGSICHSESTRLKEIMTEIAIGASMINLLYKNFIIEAFTVAHPLVLRLWYSRLSVSAVQMSGQLVPDCPIPFVLLHISDVQVISSLLYFLVCVSG